MLVDARAAMSATSNLFIPVSEKQIALASAEKEVQDLLLSPGRLGQDSWFRQGKDYITLVQYGIGLVPRSTTPGMAGQLEKPEDLYVKRVVWANNWMSRKRLAAALQVRTRTYSNTSSLALNPALSTANVPGLKIQDTYVIVISDDPRDFNGRSIDPSSVGILLSDKARNRIRDKQRLVDQSLSLEGKYGSSEPWLMRTFGKGADTVSVRVFKAVPKTTAVRALNVQNQLSHLGLSVEDSGEGLKVALNSPRELIGLSAFFTLEPPGAMESGQRVAAKPFIVSGANSLSMRTLRGNSAVASLFVAASASNPILGRQEFRVQLDQDVTLPAGLRMRSMLKAVGGLVGLFVLLIWSYIRLSKKVRFCFWLPGYVTSFALPALPKNATSDFILRMPTTEGELAAVVTLPPFLVRKLFCRTAVLQWDARLECVGMPSSDRAKLTELPTVVKLVWQERPSSGGHFDIAIERELGLGRNQHAKIHVRFLALPQRELRSLENP